MLRQRLALVNENFSLRLQVLTNCLHIFSFAILIDEQIAGLTCEHEKKLDDAQRRTRELELELADAARKLDHLYQVHFRAERRHLQLLCAFQR